MRTYQEITRALLVIVKYLLEDNKKVSKTLRKLVKDLETEFYVQSQMDELMEDYSDSIKNLLRD
jgi:hypothetical protein